MIITAVQLLLSVVSGIVVGFTLGLIGGGGSILAIPLLIYFVGVHNTHFAIGTTALAVGVNAYLNFISHRKKVHINVKVTLLFSLIGAVGVILGSSIGLLTNSGSLLLLFSFLMVGVGIFMFLGGFSHSDGRDGQKKMDRRDYGKVSYSSLATGFASGFFGIGGGFLIVPALMYSTKIRINEAIGTSLFVVGTFGVLTAVRYGLSGSLLLSVSLFYIIGGIVGGIIGTRVSTGMDTNKLKKLFSVIVVIVGFYVMARTLGIVQ